MRHLKLEYYLWVVMTIAAGVWWLSTPNLPPDWFLTAKIGGMVSAALAAAWLFDTYVWRWSALHDWLVPFPDLNGTWSGNIQSTWKDPKTGKPVAPISTTLVIKQSFSRLSAVMLTGEMRSDSVAAEFVLEPDAQIRKLIYSYRSRPIASVTHRSPEHDGTAEFQVIQGSPMRLKGRYWTARGTTGDIDLTFASVQQLEEFPKGMPPHPMSPK